MLSLTFVGKVGGVCGFSFMSISDAMCTGSIDGFFVQ